MAKQWYSIKLSGGMTHHTLLDKARERATAFINQHNLGADEFKVTFFDETDVRGNVYMAWAIVFYFSETELGYREQ